MKGSYEIIVKNNRVKYKFTLYRNITILRGDSATGKTTLIDMIDSYCKDGVESGVTVQCAKKCVVLDRYQWVRDLQEMHDSIVFIDEGNKFVKQPSFADMVKNSDNYYVIATRDSLFNLPYSIKEIYGIRNISGNRYQETKRIYSGLYPLYNKESFNGKPDKVIIEDSNSAYQFFKEVCKKENIKCESAKGKSNIFDSVQKAEETKIMVVADGAAFGPEMERNMSTKRVKNSVYFLPESFEWLILKSGLINKKELKDILDNPSEFIESEKYFSWEVFFTKLLIQETKDNVLSYKKSKLNNTYLSSKNKKKIIDTVNEVAGDDII